nr:MAG TPA: hypothetical protein [Caudoviricetes sp.]DAS52174.1 MAG TPA: hypothetical protein [Caudoviricetes sp.]DAS61536.1 MAG TPA: hypothetical protein [Caudoviricetes sp.]
MILFLSLSHTDQSLRKENLPLSSVSTISSLTTSSDPRALAFTL